MTDIILCQCGRPAEFFAPHQKFLSPFCRACLRVLSGEFKGLLRAKNFYDTEFKIIEEFQDGMQGYAKPVPDICYSCDQCGRHAVFENEVWKHAADTEESILTARTRAKYSKDLEYKFLMLRRKHTVSPVCYTAFPRQKDTNA